MIAVTLSVLMHQFANAKGFTRLKRDIEGKKKQCREHAPENNNKQTKKA